MRSESPQLPAVNGSFSTGQPKFPHALGTAMKGLVTAEGNSQSMQSSATKQWSTQIGNAYRAAAHGGALFPVPASPYPDGGNPFLPVFDKLDAGQLPSGDEINRLNPDDESYDGIGGNGGNGGGNTYSVDDFNHATNTADDGLDQSNANAESARVTAVTGVRDTLGGALETADGDRGSTMDAAGAALGGALDGIQDFDWQNVRDFVGEVSGERRSAEIGALTAQVGMMSSYFSAKNGYTSAIASASVTHAGAYAQATADYFVNSADRAADEAEAANTPNATALRAKSDAFTGYASSYVSYITTEAQSAATTTVAGVATANANALADLTADVATTTSGINSYYDGMVADAQNAPPIDMDGDGLPDPPEPSATASIAASINAQRSANTASRTTIYSAFAEVTAPRTTSTTNTVALSASTGGGANTGGGNANTAYSSQPQSGSAPAGDAITGAS